MDSVLGQDYDDVEYIVVDPGSTDGSRGIVAQYGDRVVTIFEADSGPADGLNRGFARATGDVFCYLNSDDTFLPGAFSAVAGFLATHPDTDVVRGHGNVIDENGRAWRRLYSDSFSLGAVACGACLSVQPSTFLRAESFRRVDGFNVRNRSNWDEELLVDMALAGAKIATVNEFLSCYRVHRDSITGSGRLDAAHEEHTLRMFEKVKGRPFRQRDRAYALAYRLLKHGRHPRAFAERLSHGPVYRSA
jgi:glycosyltransferase involved in cell wall biosynthesis